MAGGVLLDIDGVLTVSWEPLLGRSRRDPAGRPDHVIDGIGSLPEILPALFSPG
jgi:hypothetical protein